MFKTIKTFLKENKSAYLFLFFLVSGGFYFISKFFTLKYHIIHIPFDDKIPFIPEFCIPYVLWFPYVPLLALCTFIKDKKDFVKLSVALFSGMILCSICFIVYPSMVDFRPTAEGKGFFLFVCRIIYANDTPSANVFPSLHCFEALTVHLGTFTFGPFRENKIWHTLSFILVVLICMSTVFIKQHSIVDVFWGCLLSVVLMLLSELIFYLRGRKNVHTDS